MDNQDLIEDVIEINEYFLGLEIEVEFVDFDGRARYLFESRTIVINQDTEDIVYIMFIICHEFFHAYQHEQGMLDGVMLLNSGNIEDYNNQQCEIDANAYACFLMRRIMGSEMTTKGLSDEVMAKVRAREAEMARLGEVKLNKRLCDLGY